MAVPERQPKRLEHLEVGPAQRTQHSQFRPVKFGQVKLAARGQHPARFPEGTHFQLVRQFMQQEEHHVGVSEPVRLLHRGGVVLDVFDLVRVPAQLALHVHQLVRDEVGDQDPLRTRFDRRLHHSGNHVTESAGGDQHLAAPQVGRIQAGHDLGHQAVVLEQQDGRDDGLEVHQLDQPHVGVDRVHMLVLAAGTWRQSAHDQRAAGKHEEEEPRHRHQEAKAERRVRHPRPHWPAFPPAAGPARDDASGFGPGFMVILSMRTAWNCAYRAAGRPAVA